MNWISALFAGACLLTSLQAGPSASTPIPADSKSPYEFRGKPTADYPPYTAVFQAKTYGELKERLENFFKRWEEDKKPLDDLASLNMYFQCQGALARTCYLLGDVEAGDGYLMKHDPVRASHGRLSDRALEQGKLPRIAKEIQAIHLHLGLEDPFPKGPPKNVNELYQPLAAISEATYAKREKEPEEELEDSNEE
jgi:hypothetical protein